VSQARADETTHDKGYGVTTEGLYVEVGARETASRVKKADVRGDGEAKAVEMKDQRTDVKRCGKGRHLGPRST
jgi:hypothetical protein